MRRITAVFLFAFALLGVARAESPGAADPRLAPHVLGDPNAPVQIDEYFALDCPVCAEFDTTIVPMLKSDYIDKGKVKLVLHDFPVHTLSVPAAQLARCMPADRYFPFADTLFRTQKGWAGPQTGPDPAVGLKQQAKFAGLTDAQIAACLADRPLEDGILQSRLDAQNTLKINATPTLIFNRDPGDRIVGVPSYDALKRKIDGLIKK